MTLCFRVLLIEINTLFVPRVLHGYFLEIIIHLNLRKFRKLVQNTDYFKEVPFHFGF